MTSVASLNGIEGLRVLVLPKNSRLPYFHSFLKAARDRCQWSVHVVCEQPMMKYWPAEIVSAGSFVKVPNFTKVQPWERNTDAVAEIDAFISACERSARVSSGRILLAGERDLGRGFSLPTYYWFHTETAKAVLNDNLQPFLIVRRMFAFARDVLCDVKPDIVVAGEWADALHFVFYLAARRMGITCVTNRFSKIWTGRGYWSTDPLMYNESTRLAFRNRPQDVPISAKSLDRLISFRDRPTTLGYVAKNWQQAAKQSWLSEQVTVARMGVAQIRYVLRGRDGPSPKPAWQVALDFNRRRLLRVRQGGLFERLDNASLMNARYFLIALHKDPEQALNHQAAFWSNQFNTVALVSAALPAGYSLLVREHRLNLGRRPTAFYREMKRLPGVKLIDATDDQYKYIANADLIFTENASVGWEGLMLKRRVITLAPNFYEEAGLATRIRDPERLAETVIDVLERDTVKDPEQHDRDLCRLMDAEFDCTMPLDEIDFSVTLRLLAEKVSASRVRTL